MKEIKIVTTIRAYDSAKELPENFRSLLKAARKSLQTAYAPYSGFRVGAAVQLAGGEIISGANQENAAYPMCLCAERVALAAAAARFPGQAVEAMAIAIKNERKETAEPAAPCGACRQVICETETRYGNNISILLQAEKGKIYLLDSGKSLLPLSFDRSFL